MDIQSMAVDINIPACQIVEECLVASVVKQSKLEILAKSLQSISGLCRAFGWISRQTEWISRAEPWMSRVRAVHSLVRSGIVFTV